MCPVSVAVPWAALPSAFPRPPHPLLPVRMVSFLKEDDVPRTLQEHVEYEYLPFSGSLLLSAVYTVVMPASML